MTWMHDLPYPIHTGRELEMMLAGDKPLARFCDDIPDVPDNGIVPYESFEPHVASGRMVRRDREFIFEGVRCLEVYYALRGEEWRIDAMMLVFDTGRRDGWSDSLERLEGRLLGYTAEQNDIFMAMRAARFTSAP